MILAAVTVTTVRALLAVWLATTPGPLAPGPGQPRPDRAAAAWAARAWTGPERATDRVTAAPVEATREDAFEDAENEEDERGDFARGLLGERLLFLDSVGPPPRPGACRHHVSAQARPLFLLCSRLTC
jgi:hypothetical protein